MAGELPSVAALAYLGDAVHSLFVRSRLVQSGLCKSGTLHAAAQTYVTAEAQTTLYHRIADLLTEEEVAVFRRAFNSGHLQRPKHASGAEYRTATGFEAVLGLLYHTAQTERLYYLLERAHGEDLCHADD